MGLQGNKATHDFLSLYTAAGKDSPLPLPQLPGSNSKPPPSPPAQGHQWTLPFGAARSVAVASSRPQPQSERKGAGCGGFMDAGSGSSAGAGFDDEDGLAARREVSSSLKELTVRVEAKGGSCSGSAGTDQLPNTPRSKHSATEQRRRSKINDRFQLLREILPHNDQKRDKASFLLEVIEYIRFLQEKVQKYEVSYPEGNQENGKIVPWANMYFRSFWKNYQNKDQIPGDVSPDPSQIIKNGSSPDFPFIVKPDDNDNGVASVGPLGALDQAETDPLGRMSHKSTETSSPDNLPDIVATLPQAHPTRSSPADGSAMIKELLHNPELAIDEGTISLSSQYSQELLSTLNHALQSSGIDLSQASISVQINLGKRATKTSDAAANAASTELVDLAANSQTVDHQLRFGGGAQEHRRATKRRKSDNS